MITCHSKESKQSFRIQFQNAFSIKSLVIFSQQMTFGACKTSLTWFIKISFHFLRNSTFAFNSVSYLFHSNVYNISIFNDSNHKWNPDTLDKGKTPFYC